VNMCNIFRFVVGFLVVLFLGMLFYSSHLIESDLKEVQRDLDQIESQLQQLRAQVSQRAIAYPPAGAAERASAMPLAYADPTLPNLLSEDHFYSDVLPEILPDSFTSSGVIRYGETGRPEDLHPFGGWRFIGQAYGWCGVSVASTEFGKYGTMAPGMALKIEERPIAGSDRTEYWVFLRGDVYWQPLRQSLFPSNVLLDPHFLKRHLVTAHDFKFRWDAMMNPHVHETGASAGRTYFSDIEEFRVVDDLTFVVRWRAQEVVDPTTGEMVERTRYNARELTGGLSPLPRWLYQYFPDGEKIIDDGGESDAYRYNSVWAQNFSQHWARNIIPSCGAWIFDGVSEDEMRFRRNPDHFEPHAALTEATVVRFRDAADALWQDFKAGNIDWWSSESVPDKLLELPTFLTSQMYEQQAEKGGIIRRIDYLDRSYRYIGWNFRTPFFSSAKVRRAMTMAIDRDRIISSFMSGMGEPLTGPIFPTDPEYNHEIQPIPYDPVEAIRLLEEEGWYDMDGDGIRDKIVDGKREKFRFRLLYYVKSTTGRAICDAIATSLRDIGVECLPTGLDVADLALTFEGKDFDAIYLAWTLGTPPSEPRQIWHSSGAFESGSSNAIGFVNAEADELIERLQYTYDQEERLRLYHRFHEIIHEEAPYTFLLVPKVALLYRDYLQQVFIPAERQDLVPGADVELPSLGVSWIRQGQR